MKLLLDYIQALPKVVYIGTKKSPLMSKRIADSDNQPEKIFTAASELYSYLQHISVDNDVVNIRVIIGYTENVENVIEALEASEPDAKTIEIIKVLKECICLLDRYISDCHNIQKSIIKKQFADVFNSCRAEYKELFPINGVRIQRALNVSPQMLSNYSRYDKDSLPSIETLVMIADFYDITVDQLINPYLQAPSPRFSPDINIILTTYNYINLELLKTQDYDKYSKLFTLVNILVHGFLCKDEPFNEESHAPKYDPAQDLISALYNYLEYKDKIQFYNVTAQDLYDLRQKIDTGVSPKESRAKIDELLEKTTFSDSIKKSVAEKELLSTLEKFYTFYHNSELYMYNSFG